MKIFSYHAYIALLSLFIFSLLFFFPPYYLLLFVLIVTVEISFEQSKAKNPDWGKFVKTLFVVPLGLGSIACFRCLTKNVQDRKMQQFSYFINFAVISNILMMIFVPSGKTFRGVSSKVVCFMLVAYLLKEMELQKWHTVYFEDGIFLFTASPLKWAVCHAIYRMVLITLPAFDTPRHVSLEFLSIMMMFLLSYMHGKHPPEFYFGFADTIVVASACIMSTFYSKSSDKLSVNIDRLVHSKRLDLLLVLFHFVVCLIVLRRLFLDEYIFKIVTFVLLIFSHQFF